MIDRIALIARPRSRWGTKAVKIFASNRPFRRSVVLFASGGFNLNPKSPTAYVLIALATAPSQGAQ
jgi:hypothetical protein